MLRDPRADPEAAKTGSDPTNVGCIEVDTVNWSGTLPPSHNKKQVGIVWIQKNDI
jgi:hypothetical protein